MAFDVSTISRGTRNRAPRIVLLGVEKIGKSTFASQAPSPVFLPIKGEEGIDDIDVAQFPTCGTLSDIKAALLSLYNDPHEHQTVVVDSVSAMEPLVWGDVCVIDGSENIDKACGGYAKGYNAAADRFRMLTAALDSLRVARGMASILIGHIKVKRFDDPAGPSYDQYQFDCHEKVANLLFRWADCILFANTKVAVKTEDKDFGKTKGRGLDITGGERFLYTQKRPSHPGGGRGVYGQLAYEMPFTWGHFQDAVASAMNAHG